MSKQHRKHTSQFKPPAAKVAALSPETARVRGLDALKRGFYTDAIHFLERAAKLDASAQPLLAEAFFRRAVAPKTARDQRLQDLLRATALQPNDAQYYYHLGLAHHQRGELNAALLAYEITASLPQPPRGLPYTFALARLETDSNADLNGITGLSEPERDTLDLLARLLRGDTSFLETAPSSSSWFKTLLEKLSGGDAAQSVWRGLGYLLADDAAAAQNALESANGLAPHVEALRHYYLGVAAARRGDWSAAAIDWQNARARGMDTVWLRANLAGAALPGAAAALRAENWRMAAEHARAALRADPTDQTAAQIAAIAMDRLARAEADNSNWMQAAILWIEASELYARTAKTDDMTRALLQNSAIAAEHADQWEHAARAWRALLQTKPRGKKAKMPFNDAQWAWMRRRAMLAAQKAGKLGDVITLLKAKIKQEPNDLTARMELAETLLANEQPAAARNELARILDIEPAHTAARLRLAEWHARRGEWHAAESQVQELLDKDPHNESARKFMATLMAQRGRTLHESGRVDAARAIFQDALQFAPNNADLYIDMARALLDLRQADAARQAFQDAYRVGGKQVNTHEQIVRCWIIDRNETEMQNALTRAAQETKPPPLFYVHLGLACLANAAPRAPFASPKPSKQDEKWNRMARELVAQGVALTPNDPELLRHVIMDCIQSHTDIGLPYAERLILLTPDDPSAWITAGVFHATNGDVEAAKKKLKEAARVAKQQGNRDAEQTANQMRRELDNPFASFLLNSGLGLATLLGGLEEQEEFFDAEDLDADELFWTPPRRKRGRR